MGELLPEAAYSKKGIISKKMSVYLPNYVIENNDKTSKYIKILRISSEVKCIYLSVFTSRVDGNTSNCEVLVYRHKDSGYPQIRGYVKIISEHLNLYTPKFYIDKTNNDLYISIREYTKATLIPRTISGNPETGIEFDCRSIIESVEEFIELNERVSE